MVESVIIGCIHELFEDQVLRTPNAVAVEFGDQRLSYATINSRANELAHRLLMTGLGLGDTVGMLVERSPEMVITFLAILKSGCVCVPLDISEPIGRMLFVIQNAGIKILVTSRSLDSQIPPDAVQRIYQDEETNKKAEGFTANPRLKSSADDAAYVIYTSGSTGTPKGVVGSHASLLNGLHWMWEAYPFDEFEVCCHTTISQSVIDSIWEIFLPLLKGIRLIIIPETIIKEPSRLISALNKNQVTRIALVPSLLRVILESCPDLKGQLAALKYCMSSGEPLGVDLAESFLSFLPDSRLLNLYGLSEVPDVTYYEVQSVSRDAASIPIGRPVVNITLYLLDRNKNLVPRGEPGELYVSGPGLALGYLGRPDLTSERFIPDHIGKMPGGRLYNTGDLARYRDDGSLEYLGRLDMQVKIRGFRVEISEIELALMQHPHVRQGIVVAREDDVGGKSLAAYLLSEQENHPTDHELRSYLKEKVPYYMIPSEFIWIDSIPFSRSGKIDRQALLQIKGSKKSRPIIAPRNLLELRLTQIWENVLKTGPISVTDKFFDLGGDSLAAIYLVCQIEDQLGELLPLSALIEAGSIADLAKLLSEKAGPLPYKPLAAIRKTGSRPPLFLVHGIGGEVMEFLSLAHHLGADQPLYGLQAPLATHSVVENRSIEEVATEYVEAVQEIQPKGPYFLGGYSWGGMVAFEMAQQFLRLNEETALLAILDTEIDDTPTESVIPNELEQLLKDKEHLLLTHNLVKLLDPEGRFKDELKRLEIALSNEHITDELGEEYRRSYVHGFIARTKAFYNYCPKVFAGKVTLFRTEESTLDHGWSTLSTAPVDVFDTPGNHWGMIREPHVQILAKQLRHCIDRACHVRH